MELLHRYSGLKSCALRCGRGYNYAARLCLAAVDIQHGEIVGWKVESRYKLWLSEKRQNRKKEKNA